MRLTSNVARSSIVVFAAVFAILTALWIRSAGRAEYLGVQFEEQYLCRLMQSNGTISLSTESGLDGFMKPGLNWIRYDTYKPEPGENLWRGKFWFGAELYSPFGFSPSLRIGIPHWFALCVSVVLLVPAIMHRRIKIILTESGRGDGIAPVTPPTPPDMRVRIRRFLSDDGDRP